MPENITTVLNLPDADFGNGGFSNPTDNRVYILQGEGSDRDRKVSLGDLFDWLVGTKVMTNESPQHRVGDIVFKIEDTRGGKILTAYVMKGRTLEKPTVTVGLKADSIEGTNQGQGDTKYLILSNTTVTGATASSTGRPAGSRTPTDAILAACGYAGTPCVNSENSTEDASSIPHSTGHGGDEDNFLADELGYSGFRIGYSTRVRLAGSFGNCDDKQKFDGFTANFIKRIGLRRDLLGAPA